MKSSLLRFWLWQPLRLRRGLSLAAVALLLLAAFQPRLPWRLAPRWTVVVDLSESVDRAALSHALEVAVERLPRDTRWVAFAGATHLADNYQELQRLEIAPLVPAATDLAAALEVAATTFDRGAGGRRQRVLLLSDGLATRGDAGAATDKLVRGGVELWALCGRKAPSGETSVRESAQNELRQKEFEVLAQKHLKDLRQDASIEIR